MDKGEDGSVKTTGGDTCGTTIEIDIGDLDGERAEVVAPITSGEVGGSGTGVFGTVPCPCKASLAELILDTH